MSRNYTPFEKLSYEIGKNNQQLKDVDRKIEVLLENEMKNEELSFLRDEWQRLIVKKKKLQKERANLNVQPGKSSILNLKAYKKTCMKSHIDLIDLYDV